MTATVGGVVVSFPAAVAEPGTQATVKVDEAATPKVQQFAAVLSAVVRIELSGAAQPAEPVQISIPVRKTSLAVPDTSGEHVVFASAVSSDGSETYLPGAFNQDGSIFTFSTTHFSDFKLLGFDVGEAMAQARTAIMQSIGLEIPPPDCVDKPTTVDGVRYAVVSTAQTYLCVENSKGNLVVTAHPGTAMPFRITSSPTADAVTESTKVSISNAAMIAFARGLALIDKHGIAAAFSGARARLTFKGAPAAVHLELEQYPVLLLMAILAKTLDVMGVAALEKLDKVEWLQCLGDVTETNKKLAEGANGETAASFITSFLSCADAADLSLWGRFLLAALTAAPGFLVTSVVGILNEFAGQARYQADLNVTVQRPAAVALGAGAALTLNGVRYGRGGPDEVAAVMRVLGQPEQTTDASCYGTKVTVRRWNGLVVYSLKNRTVLDEGSGSTAEAGGVSGWLWNHRIPGIEVKGPEEINLGSSLQATLTRLRAKNYSVDSEAYTIRALLGDTVSARFDFDPNSDTVSRISSGICEDR